MPERSTSVEAEKRIELRIGINLGDVIVEGDDLYGDGVNIAARIEALANAGGVFVSNTVHDQVRDRLPFVFKDLGEQQVKNIARPVRVYRVRDLGATAKTPSAAASPVLPLPDKPSIAVLAFANMSGDPEQEYFVDGMVEEIITALSRIRWFFVLARNSSFTYKGQAVDVKQVGRELGVRYVLEGSVRKAGQRVRITAQLIDAQSGSHLWADRFDGSLEDVFDLQDKVAIGAAGIIEPTLRQAEIERARRTRADSLDAYDLYLRALPFAYTSMPEDADKALGFVEQAIKLEPDFAVAHSIIAWCQEQRYMRRQGPPRSTTPVWRFPRVATTLPLAIAGLVIGFLDPLDYTTALDAFGRSLALSPSSALAPWLQLSHTGMARRERDSDPTSRTSAASQPFRSTEQYSPHGHCYRAFWAGRFEESATAANRATQAHPRFSSPYWMRAAALANLGRIDEAKLMAQRLLEVQPQFTIGSITSAPFANREIFDAMGNALRHVGLPE